MVDSVLIREASLADIPAIVELERRSDTASHWREEDYVRVFAQDSPARLALVAEQSGVLGFVVAVYVVSEWEIENLVIVPEMRRQGIASRLLEQVFAYARRRGGGSVFLEVRESNQAARELYRHSGFVKIGKRPGYYSTPQEDACIYKKSL